MRVRVLDAETFYELNVRYTDDLAEDYGLDDADADEMDSELRKSGRYLLASASGSLPSVYLVSHC